MIGEPDAGNPHVRFDEGAQEPSLCGAPASYSTERSGVHFSLDRQLGWDEATSTALLLREWICVGFWVCG